LKDLHNSRLQIFLTNLFLIHAPSDISWGDIWASLFFVVCAPRAANQSKIDMLSRSRNRCH
jgi:hypothetical protein